MNFLIILNVYLKNNIAPKYNKEAKNSQDSNKKLKNLLLCWRL